MSIYFILFLMCSLPPYPSLSLPDPPWPCVYGVVKGSSWNCVVNCVVNCSANYGGNNIYIKKDLNNPALIVERNSVQNKLRNQLPNFSPSNIFSQFLSKYRIYFYYRFLSLLPISRFYVFTNFYPIVERIERIERKVNSSVVVIIYTIIVLYIYFIYNLYMLAFVIPYRNREKELLFFNEHMKKHLNMNSRQM